jgi:twitching motility protein PilT
MELRQLLKAAMQLKATDVLLKADSPPLFRLQGDLLSTDLPALTAEQSKSLARQAVSEEDWLVFHQNQELDTSFCAEGLGRFRINLFFQQKTVAACFRIIPIRVPTLEELGVPPICRSLLQRPRGLILVTGPTGSGKTTTQAAMVDFINTYFPCHIITVEDPIEYAHEDKSSLVCQREIGQDTASFDDALRSILREDPDVILIGEMRDRESTELALQAAETGHLVITTLHTMNAAETINRILDIFPSRQQQQVRVQLAMNLLGVVSQTLSRQADGNGLVAAFEVLIAVPAVKAAIRDNKIYQIPSLIQTGMKSGMITLDRSLAELVHSQRISYEEGLCRSIHPDEFTALALQEKSTHEAISPVGINQNGATPFSS